MRRLFISAIAGCIACLFLASTCWALPDLESLNDYELTRFGEEAQAELERRGEKSIEDLTTEELQALIDEVNALKQKRLAERFSNYPVTRFEDSDDVFMGIVHKETGERITMDMSLDQVEAILGEPDESSGAYLIYPEYSLFIKTYDSGKIREICLTSSRKGSTAFEIFNGITIGYPMDIVRYTFYNQFIIYDSASSLRYHFQQNEAGEWVSMSLEDDPAQYIELTFMSPHPSTDGIDYIRFAQNP